MKTNFALTLSFEGIGLLHRTQPGWHLVGDVAMDAPDLGGALAALAAKARALDPTGLRSKLVIPNDQIKYLAFESDSQDVDILDAQVRGALDGATPYALAELVYDWSVHEGMVYVAAVAKETLVEAETFTADHAFNPLCFVSIPDAGRFRGEPYFGLTDHAINMLGPDEAVQRDDEAIRIVGAARLPEPKPVVVEEAPEPNQPTAEVSPPLEATPKPAEAAPPPKQPEAQATGKDDAAPVSFSSIRADATNGAGLLSSFEYATDKPELPKARFNPAVASPGPAQPEPPVEPRLPKSAPAKVSGVTDGELPKDEAARRGATLRASTPPTIPPAPPDIPETVAAPEPEPDPSRVTFLSRRKPGAPTPELKTARDGGKGWGLNWRKDQPAASNTLTAVASTQQAAAGRQISFEKDRMTVFGARNPGNAPADKPRYLALILTALLLLILVGLAAWAALFLDDGLSSLFRSSDEVQIVEEAASPAEDESAGTVPVLSPEADDTLRQASLPTENTQDPEAAADATLGTIDVLREPTPDELTPDEARARYAATGIWQMAPKPSIAPAVTTREDVYQTSLDRSVNFSDAVALPEADSLFGAARPTTPADPPPPGVDFERDERGFIAATPEGTKTPEGILVFAGRPAIEPPPTPPRAAPEVAEGPETAAPVEAMVRPRLRPNDLTELFERSNLGGRTRVELGNLRPKLRPKSPQELAIEIALAEAEAGADAVNSDDPLASATAQAVAVSLKPQTRPASFATIVADARVAAASEPVSEEQRVAINIPSTASVARAATEKNQITLRRVNLIGVYGQPSSRRALVRLANGRYQKVQVGDRLDGGKVAAIGEDELRYIKSGRSVVLKMPKG